MLHLHNPWEAWAQEEKKRLRLYFATGRYEMAWQELQRLLAHLESGEREVLRAVASAVEGYRDWGNFRHRNALPRLGQALRFLKPYALGVSDQVCSQFVLELEANQTFLQRLTARDTRNEAYILDLVANADRRARLEGKHEDAVARLYSALERGARFRLQGTHGMHTEDVKPQQIPETLRDEYEQKYRDPRDGKLKVPLLATYRLLDALGDDLGQAFVAQQDEIRELLGLRNQSPLGHGEDPVGEAGYRRFRSLLLDLLGIDDAALPRFPELWV